MLSLTLLTALVLLTAWDAAEAEESRQLIPVESHDREPPSRQ